MSDSSVLQSSLNPFLRISIRPHTYPPYILLSARHEATWSLLFFKPFTFILCILFSVNDTTLSLIFRNKATRDKPNWGPRVGLVFCLCLSHSSLHRAHTAAGAHTFLVRKPVQPATNARERQYRLLANAARWLSSPESSVTIEQNGCAFVQMHFLWFGQYSHVKLHFQYLRN